jgi:nitrite reductase/ring-hydroxylating ferredoxin subunit
MRRMVGPAQWRCRAQDLAPGHTVKFRLASGARTIEGFLVNHRGHFAAYVNRCPHVGTPLDLWPNEFFTDDGEALVCSTHGAVFEPGSGLCTGGPCAGDALEPLGVRREGDTLIVSVTVGTP